MTPHSTPPTHRSSKAHRSPFQMLLVAVALLACLVPTGRES